MKRILVFLIITIFSVNIVSCSKENVSNNNNNPGPTDSTNNNNNNSNESGNYVDKAFYIDSTAAGEDTTGMTTLVYDNSHRVTWSYDSIKTNGNYVFLVSSNFEYAGPDTLAFRSTETIVEGAMIDTIIHYFSYDNSARIEKDSAIHASWDAGTNTQIYSVVKRYQYLPGKIYGSDREQQIFPTTGAVVVTNDTATLDVNGNIVSNIKTRDGYSRYVTTLSYDTHPNPVKKLNIGQNGEVFPNGFADVYTSNLSPNNVNHVSDIRTGASAGSDDLPIQIIYGTNGYPLSMSAASLSTPGLYEKIAFLFRNL
jgi:hypothetical protein